MKLIRYIFKALVDYKYYLFGQLVCVVLAATDLAFRPYLLKLIIDFAAGVKNTLFNDKMFVITIFSIIQLSVFIIWRIFFWCNLSYEAMLKNSLTKNLLKKVLVYRYDFFEKKSPGIIASHIKDIATITPLIINIILGFIRTFWLLLLSSVILWFLNPVFTILLITWVVIYISIPIITRYEFRNASTRTTENYSKVYSTILDSIKNILPVQTFFGYEIELMKLKKEQSKFLFASKSKKNILLKIYLLQGFIVAIYQLSCLIFLFHFHEQNLITIGDFTLVLITNITLMINIWQTSDEIRMIYEHYSNVLYSLEFLEIEDSNFIISKSNKDVVGTEIIFNEVKFSYNKAPTLSIPYLKINVGQKIGIVGHSGSGKSTFAKLLMNLHNVNSGEILIGGYKINEIDNHALRNTISFVPQEISIFNGTISENISYGCINASEKELISASKKAQIHSLIKKLPNGYDTVIGENGIQISTGEKQRLAIARVILKNSQILIFDEHTSHQDSIYEFMLKEEFNKALKNKTILIIAHRLSALEKMDRILVFDSGKIIQDGSHKLLLKEDGMYKKLWDQQLLKY